jgi:hypothetical protein
MYSRLFQFMIPLVAVLAIIGFSALAQEDHSAMEHEKAPLDKMGITATVTPDALVKGQERAFTVKLSKADMPVSLAALEERHTQKIHLLVVDESLVDYHHVHPVAGADAGSYNFSFMPQSDHNYVVYADVKLLNNGAQMIPVKLKGAAPCAQDCTDRTAALKASTAGVTGKVTFADAAIKAGTPVNAEVELTGEDGKPLQDLEPVMGAYGHIVGFYEGLTDVAHMHPMGKEPSKDSDRSASPLKFMLHPEHAGYMKFFVQIRRGGKDVFLPFGVNIAKAD